MTQKTWRDIARPIIASVLEKNKGAQEWQITLELRKAYPFGERKRHPYKIWCDEIREQRGLKIKAHKLKRWELINNGQQEMAL